MDYEFFFKLKLDKEIKNEIKKNFIKKILLKFGLSDKLIELGLLAL